MLVVGIFTSSKLLQVTSSGTGVAKFCGCTVSATRAVVCVVASVEEATFVSVMNCVVGVADEIVGVADVGDAVATDSIAAAAMVDVVASVVVVVGGV